MATSKAAAKSPKARKTTKKGSGEAEVTPRAKGNTLVVVEHDEDTIRQAEHVIDLGPGAGRVGGWIVAEGTAAELERNPDSITGRRLVLNRPETDQRGYR